MAEAKSTLTLAVKLSASDGQKFEFPAGSELPQRQDIIITPTSRGEVSWALELFDGSGRIWGRPYTLLAGGATLNAQDQVLCSAILHQSQLLFLDCIVEGRQEGYRFDPTSLQASPIAGRPQLDAGKSLFERHFAQTGTVTPGTVRMITLCPGCGKEFKFRSLNAGINEVFYYYCDSCPNIVSIALSNDLVYEHRNKLAKVIFPPVNAGEFTTDDIAANLDLHNELTSLLRPCPCAGGFALFNPPTCPHCGATYVDFRQDILRRMNEYYMLQVDGAEIFSDHWIDFERDAD